MKVTPYQQDFILHFGEMGSRWGISRTVGQIYALLFITEQPLNADDIVRALGFSRSNVSMGLKELQSWRLIQPQHLPGDRREYYRAPEDIWQIFRTLVEERRKREIDPTLSMLRNALMNDRTGTDDEYAQARMQDMQSLIELTTDWLDDVQHLERGTAIKLMKLGGGVSKLIAGRGKRAGNS
ncbi:MAG: GbsR/MarR family transcriptional regulator [Pseudomonadota bacterium]